jgi:hypothetical protein
MFLIVGKEDMMVNSILPFQLTMKYAEEEKTNTGESYAETSGRSLTSWPSRYIIYVLEHSVWQASWAGLGTSSSELNLELGYRTTSCDKANLRAQSRQQWTDDKGSPRNFPHHRVDLRQARRSSSCLFPPRHRRKYHARSGALRTMSQTSPAAASVVSDAPEVWSDDSGNEDGDVAGSRKRRRTGNERPVSVSCETCTLRAQGLLFRGAMQELI